jgi:hypothetical protein
MDPRGKTRDHQKFHQVATPILVAVPDAVSLVKWIYEVSGKEYAVIKSANALIPITDIKEYHKQFSIYVDQ